MWSEADVIPLSTSGADLRALHAMELPDATMVVLDGPGVASKTDSGQRGHVPGIGYPVCLVTVWGNDLEQPNWTMPFQMDANATGAWSTRATGRQPLRSGWTRRLAFGRVRQIHPSPRIGFKFSKLPYQLSNTTHAGTNPRSSAVLSRAWQ